MQKRHENNSCIHLKYIQNFLQKEKHGGFDIFLIFPPLLQIVFLELQMPEQGREVQIINQEYLSNLVNI